MSDIDMNSTIKVMNGKSMTMIEFASEFGIDISKGTTLVLDTARLLEKRGQLTVVDKSTKQEKILNEAIQENVFQQVVNGLDAQEEANIQRKREAKLQETDSHSFALSFATSLDATKFETWVNSIGVLQTGMFDDNGVIKLAIKEVTPGEYTKITTRYKADNAISTGMKMTNQVVRGTTNTVNYGLTEVIAPTAKIVGEASVNIGKGLFHTLIKTGAGLINSTAKGVVDTKVALATDAECLRAVRQLQDVKNGVKRGVATKMNNSNIGSGIEML